MVNEEFEKSKGEPMNPDANANFSIEFEEFKRNDQTKRGFLLRDDLKTTLYIPKFNDVTIKCQDGIILYTSKAILASRSKYFYFIIDKGYYDKRNNQIEFEDIESKEMKSVLEYLYTSDINTDDIMLMIDTYYASIRLEIENLQERIIRFFDKKLRNEIFMTVKDLIFQLFTKSIDKFAKSRFDNKLIDLINSFISRIDLYSYRYAMLLSFEALDNSSPRASIGDDDDNLILDETNFENKSFLNDSRFTNLISKEEKIKDQLKILLSSVYLELVKLDDLIKYIEGLNIFTAEQLSEAYKQFATNKNIDVEIRGTPYFRWKSPNRKVFKIPESYDGLYAENTVGFFPSCLSTDIPLSGKRSFEWKIKIEKCAVHNIVIGICDQICNKCCIDNNHDKLGNSWGLCTDGYIYKNRSVYTPYTRKIQQDDTITVHLNMIDKTLRFSINDELQSIINEWKDEIPFKVYPFASLLKGDIIQIKRN
ncbi:525_t:CDS:2 [Entrophospora sp. SA101]|nr:525_t:CDS:2 [Entrophospora sp. SA101]